MSNPGKLLLRQSSRSIYKGLRPNPRHNRTITHTLPRHRSPQPADDPSFISIVDNPPIPVRVGSSKRHGPGLLVLALIPLTAFALGTWQVQRLSWKSELIAKFEDRLVRDPLPLPPRVDPSAIHEFDYRRVWARGRWRHDLEMLVGPRTHEGGDGYLVVTPFERVVGGGGVKSLVLVCRGWIARKFREQEARSEEALPRGEVVVEGLLREPFKKNMFTPNNNLEKGEFYFPDVVEMAGYVGPQCQAVWVEETMQSDLLETWRREEKGIPLARPAEVNLRNNHAQYIFTWYALAAATSVMLWMVVKKPPKDLAQRVRRSTAWS